MAQTLYFSVLLIALCSLSECIQRRYHHINMTMNWTEAQKYCRENYTDLATVNNINDMKQLMKSVNYSLTIYVFIGLKRSSVYKWKWSRGDPVNYTNWYNGDSNGPGQCVYMRDGSWHHTDWNMKMRFICYNGDKGFIIDDSSVSWRVAQIFCRQHHTDLISVRNQTENQEIQKIMKDKNISEVWIGLFSDSWEWSDESESGFRYWKSEQPNNVGGSEYCTAVSVTEQSQWHDVGCSESYTFVCHEDNLILINESLSWSEALRYCRENHVDLVSVDSEKIQFMVTKVIHQSSTDAVWMGLRHSCAVGLWFWVNGEMVCYQNWAPGNETAVNDCDREVKSGAIQSGDHHLWISLPQSHKLNFICIKK
ncbi:C-type mannose receptor 2-like [Misgurnus anguillicaudatus]|uniref:C-type mannose receptor 2-like n=1 Tax=Misgurnus anguillicaudatus TaxID=75329 RepID=UPI003CCF4162